MADIRLTPAGQLCWESPASQTESAQLTALGKVFYVDWREGLFTLAAEKFGPMATVCLERWGIKTTEDVGEVVFNLIDSGLLSRQPSDSRLDFVDGFDFEPTFDEIFRERTAAISEIEVLF